MVLEATLKRVKITYEICDRICSTVERPRGKENQYYSDEDVHRSLDERMMNSMGGSFGYP